MTSSDIGSSTRRSDRLGIGTALALVTAGSIALPTLCSAPTATSPPAVATVAHAVPDQGDARPRNGAVLVQRGSGSGSFTVDNEAGDTDAVVTLSRDGRAVLVLYVRAGSSATARKVPDGTFDVYAEQGSGWNPAAGVFTAPGPAGKLDRQAEFSTERVDGGIRHSTITLTLVSSNGNTRLLPVAGASIPD